MGTVNGKLAERDLFPGEGIAGPAAEVDLQHWKAKLVLANTHQRRMKVLKAEISAELRARADHYDKLAGALADAVRFKSTQELFRVFGEKWEQEVEQLEALDKYHDGLKTWMEHQ